MRKTAGAVPDVLFWDAFDQENGPPMWIPLGSIEEKYLRSAYVHTPVCIWGGIDVDSYTK